MSHADIYLGIVTLILAILGGVVSVHAPQRTTHKWAYAIAFVLLASIGIVFVIMQSNDLSATNARAQRDFDDLKEKTAEIVRIQKINSSQAQALMNIAQRNLDAATGGGSFPEILARRSNDKWSFVLIVHGPANLESVHYGVIRPTEKDAIALNDTDPAMLIDRENPLLGNDFSPKTPLDTFIALIEARTGSWNERLTLALQGGQWTQHVTVTDGKGKNKIDATKQVTK